MSFELTITDKNILGQARSFSTANGTMAWIVAKLLEAGVVENESNVTFPDYDGPTADAKREKLLRKKSPKMDQVAAYKFRSNSGWFLHPAECELLASVDLTAGVQDEDAIEHVVEFTTFCKLAAKHGGFVVL